MFVPERLTLTLATPAQADELIKGDLLHSLITQRQLRGAPEHPPFSANEINLAEETRGEREEEKGGGMGGGRRRAGLGGQGLQEETKERRREEPEGEA